MKRIVLIVSFALTLLFVACASNNSTPTDSESGSNPVEVDENLLTVDVTLSSDFLELMETTADDYVAALNQEPDPGILAAKANEDGSVSLTITKKKQKELTSGIKDTLLTMFPNENFPSIVKCEVNDDFTEVVFYVDEGQYTMADSFAINLLTLFDGSYYHMFSGHEPGWKITVRVLNNDTNAEIESFITPKDAQ